MGAFDPYSLGPWLIGVVIDVLLYGVMLVQTFQYYLRCGRDFRWVKWMVFVLFVLETIGTGLNVAHLYRYCVTLFGQVDKVLSPNWMGDVDIALTSIITTIVQIFYAYRILRFTSNRWIFGFIVASALTQCGAGIAATTHLVSLNAISELVRIRTDVIVWMSSAIANDITITSTLVFFLRDSRTGFAITDDLISQIIRMTIQTGLVTTIWASTGLILFLAFDNDLSYIFTYSLGKLYACALLSTLNARSLQDSHTTEPGIATSLTAANFGHPQNMTERDSGFAHHFTNVDDANIIRLGDISMVSSSTTSFKDQDSTRSTSDGVQEVYVGDQWSCTA